MWVEQRNCVANYTTSNVHGGAVDTIPPAPPPLSHTRLYTYQQHTCTHIHRLQYVALFVTTGDYSTKLTKKQTKQSLNEIVSNWIVEDDGKLLRINTVNRSRLKKLTVVRIYWKRYEFSTTTFSKLEHGPAWLKKQNTLVEILLLRWTNPEINEPCLTVILDWQDGSAKATLSVCP